MSFVKTGCNFLFMLSIVSFLASCGGSSSSPLPILQNPVNATLTGTVYASSVAGANVVVLNASGSTIAGPVVTAVDGSYSVSVPSSALSSDLIISSSGGTFTDEATGTKDVAAGSMAAYVAGGTLTNGSKVHLTPSSTIIADLVKNHGKTLTQATTSFFNAFGYTPDLSVAPVALSEALTVTNAAGHLAGAQAAAFSQLTKDFPLLPAQQFDLLAALADDISDGKLDGIPATTPVLTANIMKQFGKAVEVNSQNASTASYNVAYSYPMGAMGAKQGKSQFTLTITDSSDAPVTGLVGSNALKVESMMHMSGDMGHSTPLESIVETVPGTSGVYTVTIYYLMPTSMMKNGILTTMGYWEMKVTIGNDPLTETVSFYPYVDMPMAADDTPSASLYGPTDIITMGMSVENRKYTLFNEASVTAADKKLSLYVVHDEGMKKTFADVHLNAVLAAPTNTISPISLLASTNKTDWSTTPVDYANGHWLLDIGGLTGVANEVVTVYVKLAVNDEQKTKDGTATVNGTNEYASFTVKLK